MNRPLDGIRVLDLSIWMFGPICTQVLGDFGADVIKVEAPSGEPGRGNETHPRWRGFSTRFLSRNRNKRSIAIDLRSEAGQDVLLRLVQDADVVVQNFRPGVAERLGLDYETLRSRNPRVIYVAGSGYGRTGPYAALGGQDRVAQAMSGFVFGNGDPGTKPFPARTSIMDSFGGMVMVQGILLALIARHATGVGQRVDLSLFDAAIFSNIESFTTHLNTREPVGQIHDPLMSIYRTADGLLQLVMVFVRDDNPLGLLCRILGIDDLSGDERFATKQDQARHGRELVDLLEEAFRTRPTGHWLARLREHDVICSPVYDYADLAADPQVAENDMIQEVADGAGHTAALVGQPIKLSATPASIDRFPPTVGEHTDDILRAAGFDDAGIRELRDSGAVR
ncbi:CaiB/BaiF CoA transferase family protein [Jiangella asiatica]|uniref:CoA transferase n=1 Tax=Jiangella asiatica TaxID=2530372 RepID=A0A4R5CTU9_9ACTN|nr:CoA transferase [Jiangella asiatica]TDE01153.1 CoA transferase [Jiangella asiatica]